MKVQSITNYYLEQNKFVKNKKNIQNKNITAPFNLNSLNTNYNQLAFKAVSDESLKFVMQIPLQERLATVFENFHQGDLILVGKKIHKAKLRMLEALDNIDNVVKKVMFIPDEKLNGYLAFTKNKEGYKEVINLNDFDIFLIDQKGKTEHLAQNESFFLLDGDTVGVKDELIEIKPEPKTNLSMYRKNFCQVKNFDSFVKPEIEKLNRKTIAQLSSEVVHKENKVTFKDVGGQDKLIEELKRSVIYPLKYPEVYESFDVNRGFILYGPPGTGKTHIARALANEADVNFVSLNGAEMESKWVGESEENWRNLFQDAKDKQPTILFKDEFDAIAKARGGQDVYGDKVVNQILTLMTDLDNNGDNVFVLAATNNFKALDGAIIRSGRFSKHLEVKMPDLEGVKKIFDIHSAKKPLDRDLDKDALTKRLYNLSVSGADIKYIVNEAHSKGYERVGIYEKMEDGSFSMADLRKFWITKEDFDKAIQQFVDTRKGSDRRAIGFGK